jgi:lysophospholipase
MIEMPPNQQTSPHNSVDKQIDNLWQQRSEGYISGVDRKQLYWVSMTSPLHHKALVIVNGRVESAWKYQELFFDLFKQGYDIFSFDHRGQGLSDRLTEDRQIGHVDYFSDYVSDMGLLLDSFPLHRYQQRFILAHSMGGTIATRYLQTEPKLSFDAIALSAPMYGIHMPAYLRPISPYLSRFISWLYPKPTYISRHKSYHAKPFEQNQLTSSSERYHWFRDLYKQMPELQLGGPSARWVWQALLGIDSSMAETEKLTMPVLLLQGSKDTIVDNRAHDIFIKRLRQTNARATLECLSGSKHEVLFELDRYRQHALMKINHFFEQAASA